MDLELVINPARAKKIIAKLITLHCNVIRKKAETENNRRPADRSGLLITWIVEYRHVHFDHEEILCKYRSRAKLAYTDTGSYISHIQTRDLYKDMADNLDTYDTFDYPVDHPYVQRRMERS